jgi:hypothetical protein
LPVVPLVGSAAPDVPEPTWPTFTDADLAVLRPKIRARLGRVVISLIKQNLRGDFWGVLPQWALRAGWSFKSRSVVESVVRTIRADLTERGMMTPQG